MLSPEEQRFIEWWQKNRARQKRLVTQLMIGLPLGVLFGILIFVNFFSGWYKRAEMVANAQRSFMPVLLVAILLIVVFVSVFSVRHRWDQHEQRYRELKAREQKNDDVDAA